MHFQHRINRLGRRLYGAALASVLQPNEWECVAPTQAMWHFRSGVNKKQPMHGSESAQRNEDLKQLLDPLWRVAAEPVNAWSKSFVRKRFY